MPNVNRLLEIARSQIGVSEVPPDSNNTKYGEWWGWNGVPWCGIFVSYCYYQAGVELPKIGFSKPGFAGCQSAVSYWRKAGKIVKDPKPGDIVFFDFNGDGRHDHTGIFEKHLSPSMFSSIEGNTGIGNDSNGGKVMQRKRMYRTAIFVRP